MRTKTVAVLLLALFMAACAGTRPGDLEGRWRLDTATDADGAIPTDVGDRPTVFFADGRITAKLHCNTLSGDYRANSSGRFDLVDAAITDMACVEREAMDAEQRLAQALEGVTRFAIEGGTLTLEGEGITLVYTADTTPTTRPPTGGDPDDPVSSPADPGAAGVNRWFPAETFGRWELQRGVVDGEEIPIVGGFPVTLEVTELGFGGKVCNAYGFSPNPDDPEAFPQIFSTMMLCEGDGVMESERMYLEALGRFESARLDGGRLIIEGDGVQLIYIPVG